MENQEELKQLMEQLSSQVSSLADPETLDTLRQAKEKNKKTKQAEDDYLQKQKQENDQLEAELDELRQQRKELEAQLALRQDAESKREKACRLAQQRVEELEREHKSLFDQVKDIKESRKIHDGAMGDLAAVQRKPKQLQLALYQGLGVEIQTDKQENAAVACLTSANGEESLLIPLDEDEPSSSTTERIWEFIS